MPFHEKGTKACRDFFSILIAGKCGLSSGLSGNDVDRKVESICMETKQHATRIAEKGKISGFPWIWERRHSRQSSCGNRPSPGYRHQFTG